MRIIETTTDENLADFSRYLWEQRLRHRIYEESGLQIVEIAQPQDASLVRQAYQDWRTGVLVIAPEPLLPRRGVVLSKWANSNPALILLLGIALLCFPLTWQWPNPNGMAHLLTFTQSPQADFPAASGIQVWRWVTPIFLHFGILHLAFNAAVVWELGRRVEEQLGSSRFLLLIAVLAVVSNWAQYAWTPGAAFGGLSGVAYGLLGFIVMSQRLRPKSRAWLLPQGFALGLLVFLVLFSTGITEGFGLHVANAAHWGGLIAGLVLALGWHKLRTHFA